MNTHARVHSTVFGPLPEASVLPQVIKSPATTLTLLVVSEAVVPPAVIVAVSDVVDPFLYNVKVLFAEKVPLDLT